MKNSGSLQLSKRFYVIIKVLIKKGQMVFTYAFVALNTGDFQRPRHQGFESHSKTRQLKSLQSIKFNDG
jgi:hypothetical protein